MSAGAANTEVNATPLHEAAFRGHLDIVQHLVSSGSKVNKSTVGGTTPLHGASDGGHLHVVKYLVSKGAHIEEPDKDGRTPLFRACYRGHLEVVQYLASKGAKIKTSGVVGWTPLHCASANGHFDVFQYLITIGAHAQIERGDINGQTPLHKASIRGNLDIVQYLVTNGAHVEEGDDKGNTPLHIASDCGHLDIVQYLVSKGVQIEKGDNARRTALHFASLRGHLDIVQYLVSKGAQIEKVDKGGSTPLHFASAGGHLDVVQYLEDEQKRRGGAKSEGVTETCSEMVSLTLSEDDGANVHYQESKSDYSATSEQHLNTRTVKTEDLFDGILTTVAEKVVLTTEIDRLGIKMGFTPEDTYRYIATNSRYHTITYDGTLQMLRDWRKKQTRSKERSALKTALIASGFIRLADDVLGEALHPTTAHESSPPQSGAGASSTALGSRSQGGEAL